MELNTSQENLFVCIKRTWFKVIEMMREKAKYAQRVSNEGWFSSVVGNSRFHVELYKRRKVRECVLCRKMKWHRWTGQNYARKYFACLSAHSNEKEIYTASNATSIHKMHFSLNFSNITDSFVLFFTLYIKIVTDANALSIFGNEKN